jgi:hypothetical protein
MKMLWMAVVCGGVLSVGAVESTNFQVRVIASDVNLRVRPDAGTEVVAQIQEGQLLSAVRIEGEWVGVLAPTNSGLWLKKQFLKGGVVTGDKIRLRSGPGISYRDVGTVIQGTALTELEVHGDWVKVVAPPDVVLWVNRTVIQPFERNSASAPGPVPQATVAAIAGEPSAVVTNVPLMQELPVGLSRDDLSPVLGQGALVERSGTVERVPLAFFRGEKFRLVAMRNDRKVTVCYLRGNEAQMPSLVDRRMTVKGREYWVSRHPQAVLYPELVTPLSE